MEAAQSELDKGEQTLADPDLYSDAGRKDELTGLLQEQAGLRSRLNDLEWDWLSASEALEQARSSIASQS